MQDAALAAVTLQAAWRRHAARRGFAAQRRAAVLVAAVARGAAARRAYGLLLGEVLGALLREQAAEVFHTLLQLEPCGR